MVAVALFATVSVLAYGGLRTILESKQHYQQSMQRLQSLQMAFFWLGKDIESAINRGIRSEYGERLPSLKGSRFQSQWLTLTRTGWHNLLQQPRSTLQRVAYRLESHILLRDSWQVLDRAQDSQADTLELLQDVDDINIRFLDKTSTWKSQWPYKEDSLEMPIAIEVTISLADWGDVKRLFQVVGA